MLISALMSSHADASRSVVSSVALRSSNVVNLADIQFQRCRVTRSDVKLNLRVNTASGSIRRAWQGIPVGISSRWIQYLTCQYADHLSMFRFDYNSIAGLKEIVTFDSSELFVAELILSTCFPICKIRVSNYHRWD